MKTGADLYAALCKYPGMIPLAASPPSAFFLLGQHNFQLAWYDWFWFALRDKGYDVRVPTNGMFSANY